MRKNNTLMSIDRSIKSFENKLDKSEQLIEKIHFNTEKKLIRKMKQKLLRRVMKELHCYTQRALSNTLNKE
jgi:hypothetical protein